MALKQIKDRLEYLRGEITAERISTGELVELQSLAGYIDSGDVLLLEWAGVPEEEIVTQPMVDAGKAIASDIVEAIYRAMHRVKLEEESS